MILILGNGQVAKDFFNSYKDFCHDLIDRSSLDLLDTNSLIKIISKKKPTHILNAAAFTDVDQAEIQSHDAMLINGSFLKDLSNIANQFNIHLIHLSTDYIFDRASKKPILVNSKPNPVNNYGVSKLVGEKNVKELCNKYTIVRISRVYSDYGRNFVTTMLKLITSEKQIKVVDNEFSGLTNAADLSLLLYKISNKSFEKNTVLHFRNEGSNSWFDVAKEIKKYLDMKTRTHTSEIIPVSSDQFPVIAKRPKYSLLDIKATKEFYNNIPHWKTSLHRFLSNLYE